MNFPFIQSNIPAAPASGIYISQLIRYSRACGSYHDVLYRGLLLTRKILNQRFLLIKLKSSHRKSYGRHYKLVGLYGISVSQRVYLQRQDIVSYLYCSPLQQVLIFLYLQCCLPGVFLFVAHNNITDIHLHLYPPSMKYVPKVICSVL